jgi:osmotically-inducible protein OsmY
MRRLLAILLPLALLQLAPAGSGMAASPSDEQILQAAEAALGPPGGTPGLTGLKVRCDTGILTLGGIADTLSALRQAVRRAGAIPGVVDVVVSATVSRRAIPDAQVLAEVQNVLRSPSLNGGSMQASVRDGRVALTGSCGSYASKVLAEEETAKLAGVVEIVNRIQVTAETNLSEQGLSHLIQTRLASAGSAVPGKIQVSVHGDVVTLTGRVPLYLNRIEIEEAVLAIPGVREVSNRLLVDPALATPAAPPATP